MVSLLEDILTFATLGAEVERLWYSEDKPIPEVASAIALALNLSAIVSLSLDRALPRALAGRWHTFARVLDDLGQRAARHAFLFCGNCTVRCSSARRGCSRRSRRRTPRSTARAAGGARELLADAHAAVRRVRCGERRSGSAARRDGGDDVRGNDRRGWAGPARLSRRVTSRWCRAARWAHGDNTDCAGSGSRWCPSRSRAALRATRALRLERALLVGASAAVGAGTASVAVRAGGKNGGLDGAVEVLAAIGGLSLPLPSASGETAGEVSLAGEPGVSLPGPCVLRGGGRKVLLRPRPRRRRRGLAIGRCGGRAMAPDRGRERHGQILVRAGRPRASDPKTRRGRWPGDLDRGGAATGNEPLVALANAVRGLAGDDAPPLDELCARLEKPAGLTTFLREHLDDRVHGERRGLLLVIDQLEEAVTLGGEERATITAAFDAALARALRDTDGPLHLVTTIRSDQVGRLEAALPQLAALLNSSAARYTLRAMGGAALRAAIEAPAQGWPRVGRATLRRASSRMRAVRRVACRWRPMRSARCSITAKASSRSRRMTRSAAWPAR